MNLTRADLAVVVAQDLDRADQELHAHAFALGLAQLLLVDDELGAGAAVGDGHVLRAVAEAGARAVHRGVAAADDDHVLADRQRLAQVGDLHVVDAVLDAFEVAARHVQRHGVHGAGADGDGVVVLHELLEGDVAADANAVPEAHAQPLHELEVHLDGLARQPEGRDADEHRAAAVRQLVEDRHLVAGGGQLAGHGEAGRPGADDGDGRVARRDAAACRRECRWPGATPRGSASWRGWRAGGRCRRGGRRARTAPSRRRRTWPRPGWARARGCSPLRIGPRRQGSGSRGSSCRRGTLPGTRCCTAARRRRQAEPGIPGWDRWPSGLNL